jgi:uncharacterized protein YndB with AHSA1/START domain
MWFTGEYVEVDEPVRLVYTEAMTDADGAPLPDGHPPTEVCVEFAEAGEQTRMVLTHRGIPAGSPGEQVGAPHSTNSIAASRDAELPVASCS